MTLFVAGVAVGGVVIGVVVWCVVRWQLVTAEDAERRARAIRDEAARIEAQAAVAECHARALTTETAEYQTVQPSIRVRVGAALAEIREWAAGLGPDVTPTWAPGEARALGEKPPLRTRGVLVAGRRLWPLKQPIPTPADVAQRLACLQDPSRAFRIITVRTS